jgi:hypothetical protein
VTAQNAVLAESVLQHRGEREIGGGQRRQTVPDVSWGDYSQAAPQLARAAAIVHDGDDRRQVIRLVGKAIERGRESGQNHRQPGPAADSHDAWARFG